MGKDGDGPPIQSVTRMLLAISRGERDVSAELLARVYGELRTIARARMARERPDHTLDPTELVHEAYLRLLGGSRVTWENRAHFYGAAANAMRRILVDHARKRARKKHGGGRDREHLRDSAGAAFQDLSEILAVNEALSRMEERNPRGAEVVRLRFFAGLSEDEIAKALSLSPRTVRREWLYARAELFRALRPTD